MPKKSAQMSILSYLVKNLDRSGAEIGGVLTCNLRLTYFRAEIKI
jgi:hypothetical protein